MLEEWQKHIEIIHTYFGPRSDEEHFYLLEILRHDVLVDFALMSSPFMENFMVNVMDKFYDLTKAENLDA